VSQPVVVLAYATAALALAAQWIAAKVALAGVPPLELSTMRFVIASALLVVVALVTRTPLPVRRWRPVAAAAVFGFAVASVGAAIVIAGGQQLGAEISTMRILGDLLELGSAVCWAACLTISAVVVRTEGVLGFVTMSPLLGTAMLFPLGFLEHGYRDIPTWSGQSWLAVAILGERPFPLQLVGAAVILIGVRLVTKETQAVMPSTTPAPA
jgi:drug/metabolite transporter (DMT)-like permease